MSPPEQPFPLFLVFIPVVAVAIWVGASFWKSRVGWHHFAEKYPAPTPPSGKAFDVPSAKFGRFCEYLNWVRVVFTEQGVYFYVAFPYKMSHAPFLLPWDGVRIEKRKDFLLGEYFLLDVNEDAGRIHLWLPGKVEPEVMRYCVRT
jgi:hypothetical protein